MPVNILIIDDEPNHRHMLRQHLEDAGYTCGDAENGAVAIAVMSEKEFDLLILDITMDVMDGLTFLSYIRKQGNNTPVVVITANMDAKTAVSAMKLGAADYITKPVDVNQLLDVISNLLKDDSVADQAEPPVSYVFGGIYTPSGLGKTVELLSMVAPTDATVLILGESGTGKELAARSIHDNSPRAGKPFVPVNAAALNENLIESELFGHVKGAFTGATEPRRGRIAEAEGGTLFLDEVGELPLQTQVKLLRFIQEKVYEPVGSSKSLTADVRIVTATNRDPEEMVANGELRRDLYFRLSVFPVRLPPLRQRVTEIPMLIEHFIEKYAARFGKKVKKASGDFVRRLQKYSFPGNVRELENLIERSIILSRSEELTSDLLPDLETAPPSNALKENEKQMIIDVLKECNNNRTQAAARLGISRRGLYNKLREFDLE